MTARIMPTEEDAAIITAQLTRYNRLLVAVGPMTRADPMERRARIQKHIEAMKNATLDYMHFGPNVSLK